MNTLAHYYAAAASGFHEIFYQNFPDKFFTELFRKSTIIFPEISGKIPQEISKLPTLTTTTLCVPIIDVFTGRLFPGNWSIVQGGKPAPPTVCVPGRWQAGMRRLGL